jgi:tRNA (guanine37-N1)-methyltransferase
VIFSILTLFPQMFESPLNESLIRKAREKGLLEFNVVYIRDFAADVHKTCDDAPYGGGPGMVMKTEPLCAAMEHVDRERGRPHYVLLSPSGRGFSQRTASRLSRLPHLGLICGRYEGVDERVAEHLATDEISIGDYVLSGGELAAMVVVEAASRFVPGVVGKEGSVRKDSFFAGRLDYPHYTRPREFRGMKVPQVLFSGDHKKIDEWRRRKALEKTRERRPDLLDPKSLSEEDRRLLDRASDERNKR